MGHLLFVISPSVSSASSFFVVFKSAIKQIYTSFIKILLTNP
ncbi:hypothetical protein FDUTEX481_08111 [Tolypothrix sp. PCC 7601]|nr:hypothetical protein FDUTEX481_08111 [Tolypothrix sp. PCC 7601]